MSEAQAKIKHYSSSLKKLLKVFDKEIGRLKKEQIKQVPLSTNSSI